MVTEPSALLLRTLAGLPVERTPVWAMRQAGRWDPEFRKLRGNRPFYEFAADVDAAAEASLLPRRFGVDAIILFYDITTLPQALGWPFRYIPGRGPVSDQVPTCDADLAPLRQPLQNASLQTIAQLVHRVRARLRGELPVIAFAGAPFTVACYCLGAGKDVSRITQYAAEHPKLWRELLELLAERTIEFFEALRSWGADVLQLFDSWAGELDEACYEAWAQAFHRRIFAQTPAPTVLYVRECPYLKQMLDSGATAISLGLRHDLAACRRRYPRDVFQGNVDAELLARGTPEQVRAATTACLCQGGGTRHILNLNQGMPKDARPENFVAFVETARQWRPPTDRAASS